VFVNGDRQKSPQTRLDRGLPARWRLEPVAAGGRIAEAFRAALVNAQEPGSGLAALDAIDPRSALNDPPYWAVRDADSHAFGLRGYPGSKMANG